jgi:uncharacterized protein
VITGLLTGFHPALAAIALLQAAQIEIPPPPRGFGQAQAEVVHDGASVLSAEAEARINQFAFDVHSKSGGEMAFVTLADIGLRDAVDVGVAIGRAWGLGGSAEIGSRERNAGVLIMLVPKETSSTGRGRCQIVTGQGTEGFITDAQSGDICREAIPLLQQQDYSGAAVLIAQRVAERFGTEFGFQVEPTLQLAPPREAYEEPRTRRRGLPPELIIFLVIMVLMSFGKRGRGGCIPIFIPMGGRGGWGGGGFGGGFGGGGFGGGGFGGFGGGGGFSGGGGGSSW